MKNENIVKQKFICIPLLILMCTQIGASGDNAVLSISTSSLIFALHATMNDIQLANLIYSLCAGAFMIGGGRLGIIIGWKKRFRIDTGILIVGEFVLATVNSMAFIWGGRCLVGVGASLLIPLIYTGRDRIFAFGAVGAATA